MEGRREVSIISHRPVTSSDAKHLKVVFFVGVSIHVCNWLQCGKIEPNGADHLPSENKNKPIKHANIKKYCKVAILATLVTFGISSLRGLLLSGCRYPQGVVIFGDQKATLTSMVYRTTERVNQPMQKKSNSSLTQGRGKLNSVLLVHDKKNAFYSQKLSG